MPSMTIERVSGHMLTRVPAALGRRRHPVHVAVPAVLQEIGEPLAGPGIDRGRRGDARGIEARGACFGQYEVLEVCGHRGPLEGGSRQ